MTGLQRGNGVAPAGRCGVGMQPGQHEGQDLGLDGLELGPHRLESSLETGPLAWIYLSNLVLIVLTIGLYTPWATVRPMRYQLANLRVVARGDLDQFAAAASDGTDAIGEEIGDFFDVDFGL